MPSENLTLNPKASLGQIESLVRAIGRTANIANIFWNYEVEAYGALRGISYNQSRFLNMLVIKDKGRELKRFLLERGLKLKA